MSVDSVCHLAPLSALLLLCVRFICLQIVWIVALSLQQKMHCCHAGVTPRFVWYAVLPKHVVLFLKFHRTEIRIQIKKVIRQSITCKTATFLINDNTSEITRASSIHTTFTLLLLYSQFDVINQSASEMFNSMLQNLTCWYSVDSACEACTAQHVLRILQFI